MTRPSPPIDQAERRKTIAQFAATGTPTTNFGGAPHPGIGALNPLMGAAPPPASVNLLAGQQPPPAAPPPVPAPAPQMPPAPPAIAPVPVTMPQTSARMHHAAQQLQGMNLQPTQLASQADTTHRLIKVLAPLARSRSAVTRQDLATAAERAVQAGIFPQAEARAFVAKFDEKTKDLRPYLRNALEHAIAFASHLAGMMPPGAPAPASAPMRGAA